MPVRTEHPRTEETGQLRKILIVEDQPDTADMLRSYFETQGYAVSSVGLGEDAIAFVRKTIPDLVMLDIRLPDIDGYEVCRYLRAHERTKHVPIVFLTRRRELSAKLKGLELGAVDYITKPFDIQELRLRVRNVLRRAPSEHSSHPVTDLPTGPLLDERLRELRGRQDWGVLSVSLHGLERFSKTYGFVARDDVVRSVAAILTHIRDQQAPDTFLGHLGTMDFLLILDSEQIDLVRRMVETRLRDALSFFYPYADRQKSDPDLPLSFSMQALKPPFQPPESAEELKEALMGFGQDRTMDNA